jgi:hypothetical protein
MEIWREKQGEIAAPLDYARGEAVLDMVLIFSSL